ncbi:MAG: cation:proton antiporter regulatory subunit [Firmicutes bacterium]|nr:cation:proton antiporter regulatory subunit [Bacillota bacterium]
MYSIRESDLPGIGRKFLLETSHGDRVVVVIHDDGRRQIFLYRPEDPEEPAAVATMDDDEARKLAAIIGGMTYTPKALQSLEVALDDLVIDWYRVPSHAPAVGKTIGELQLRQRTGATIIALVRPETKEQRLNPGPDEVIHQNATLVVAGTRDHVRALKELLTGGNGT